MSFLANSLRTVAAIGLVAFGAATSTPAHADLLASEDFIEFDSNQAKLGQLLFYDKILSGNQNISCGTCHHHTLNGTDGLSLGIGEGGVGLGTTRVAGYGDAKIPARIPRNAPGLWNLGAAEVDTLFHDGRVEQTGPDTFVTPAGARLPSGLNSILAAQALFPMSSAHEMAGLPGENSVGKAFSQRIDLGWNEVTDLIREIDGYEDLFVAAYPHIDDKLDITIVDIANALAAFIGSEWQSFDSPYDAFLRDGTPLPAAAEKGRQLFFGDAGCVSCHNGPLFSDQNFYAVGTPQFGPGRPFGGDSLQRDRGRMETTKSAVDAYKFRTPTLRNIALTAPYGHNGAYPTLRDMIKHMCDPIAARSAWTPEMAQLPKVGWLKGNDFAIWEDQVELARQVRDLDLQAVDMVEGDIDALEAFLNALTGETALERPLGRPASVPSGLPVD